MPTAARARRSRPTRTPGATWPTSSGLDPGPELAELEHAILTQEAPRPSGVAPLDTPRSSRRAPWRRRATVARRARRVVTVLRADVVRSSDDGDLDPELLEALDRRALDVVRRAVERHGGTIDEAIRMG